MFRIAICGLFIGLMSCYSPKPPTHAAGQSGTDSADEASFSAVTEAFYWDTMAFSPVWAVALGHHQYDGKLPDRSPAAIAAEIERLHKAQKTLAAFPADTLSPTQRIERDVLQSHIRKDLFELETTREPFKNPMYYPSALNLVTYVSLDYEPLNERARAILFISEAAPDYVAQAMANLPDKMPKTWIETALLQVRGMIDFAEDDVPVAMAGIDGTPLAIKVTQGLERYRKALAKLQSFLKAKLPSATERFALGKDRFLRMLAETQGVSVSLERLEQIARDDLERNTKALAAAAHAIDLNATVADVVRAEIADKPAAGEVLDVARKQAELLRAFVMDKDIATIPSPDEAEVRESPPFMRWNSAFLRTAGVFSTDPLPSFYYISPPDPRWPEAEQRAYIPSRGSLLSTTVHEVWPGHFLHYLHRKTNPSRVLKTFCTYSMVEGWAHYAEEMVWEAGLKNGDPHLRISQILDALLRDVRFLSAIGLHTHGMSVAESMDLFRKRAYLDEANARQQAVRGTFDPGYLNYTLGKLMIRKLREDWKAKVKARYSLRAFHDELLSYGCGPIPVIRKAMLGEHAGPAL